MIGSGVIAVCPLPVCLTLVSSAYHCLALTPTSLKQVLLGPEMGSLTVHFDALRREVQLAARFNSERLVQGCSNSLYTLTPSLCTAEMPEIIWPSSGSALKLWSFLSILHWKVGYVSSQTSSAQQAGAVAHAVVAVCRVNWSLLSCRCMAPA